MLIFINYRFIYESTTMCNMPQNPQWRPRGNCWDDWAQVCFCLNYSFCILTDVYRSYNDTTTHHNGWNWDESGWLRPKDAKKKWDITLFGLRYVFKKISFFIRWHVYSINYDWRMGPMPVCAGILCPFLQLWVSAGMGTGDPKKSCRSPMFITISINDHLLSSYTQ